jgi:hypothetical protein
MKLTRDDIKELKLPIAAAAVLTVLGAGLALASERYLAQARVSLEEAKRQRAEAQTRVEQVAEEEREIRQNLVHYQDMTNRGMATEEDRLDLIDSIGTFKNERKLFEIRYQIGPQKPLDYAGIRPAGPLDLVASRMKLEMLVLHEQDLMGFIGDLERSGKAYVSLRNCTLSRADNPSTPALAIVPRLRSECQIDLVALKRAKSP